MQTLTSRVPPVVAESWRVSATRRRTVSPRRGVPAKAGDNAEIKTAEPVQARESRKEGRPVYSPDSYQDICYHVYQSVADGIADGLDLVEFIPTEGRLLDPVAADAEGGGEAVGAKDAGLAADHHVDDWRKVVAERRDDV